MLEPGLQTEDHQTATASEPRVAIILVNTNAYEVTRECLLSLRKLSYSNYFVIVVDNNSSEAPANSLEADFPEITLIRASSNLGFTGGNNCAMKVALEQGADYLLLLNNDTEVDPGFLTAMIRAGERDPSVAMLNPKIYYYEPPTRIWYAGGTFSMWRAYARHTGARSIDQGKWDRECEVTFVTGCAFLIKSEVVRRVGMLDDVFFYSCEDTDWSFRVQQAGYKGLYVPSAVIWHKESYTVKKNAGRAFRDYYNIRNGVLMARKHARWYQWPSFLAFFVGEIAYRTGGYIIKRQPNRIAAVYRGLFSGITTPLEQPPRVADNFHVPLATTLDDRHHTKR